jgi:drug/metabolite transporter (DMT)-like permease
MPADGRARALLLLALCGVLWSSAGALIKLVAWHPLAIWSVRSAIAAAFLYGAARPSLRGITRAEWGAAVALAATTGLFIAANKLTTAANAILIQYSAPIWVAALGQWFLGERASRLDWATIAIVLGGVALFFVDQLEAAHVAGNLVALAAGVAFAFSAMSLRRIARPGGSGGALRPMLLGNLLGAALGAPFVLASLIPALGPALGPTLGPAIGGGPTPDLVGWAALLALGLFQQGAAYLCYAHAIRRASALEALLIPIVEPILSPIWVMLAFGERPGRWALVGGLIVVGTVTARALLSLRPRGSQAA